MSSRIVTPECTKSTTKPSIDFLRIRALHEEMESEDKVCDVDQKYHWINMVIIIFQQIVLFLSEKFFHYWKIQNSDWGINREKKTLFFLHLVDCEENDNKALHQRWRGVKTWSINVGRGSEAKSVNDILPQKVIALNEIRKRLSNSRNNGLIVTYNAFLIAKSRVEAFYMSACKQSYAYGFVETQFSQRKSKDTAWVLGEQTRGGATPIYPLAWWCTAQARNKVNFRSCYC